MNASPGLRQLHLRPGHPDFTDLPLSLPLDAWEGRCPRLVAVERGLSRHSVVFVEYDRAVYALKELPPGLAEKEYTLLRQLDERHLPVVEAVGHMAVVHEDGEPSGVLVTRYLERSLPFRTLFSRPGLSRYQERLLDALSGLLVRLHLAGAYWGDCSLSNTLFRRDAGELQAFLVDAETAAVHERLSDGQRRQDLDILEENIAGDLMDLRIGTRLPDSLDVIGTGAMIRQRYERLWTEVTREEVLQPGETYRIRERIRALNALGFSVDEFELVPVAGGSALKLRTLVVDRDYHRHQLHSLTGLVAGEAQAALLLGEIFELRATLRQKNNRSVALSVAAFTWMEERYRPAVERLEAARPDEDPAQLYCNVLEHKWYLSEQQRADVGLPFALDDFLARFPPDPAARRKLSEG